MSKKWNQFYNTIRGPDWPDCLSFSDINQLPGWIYDEIISEHLKIVFYDDLPREPLLIRVAQGPSEINQLCESTNIDDDFLNNDELPLTNKAVCYGIEINYHPSMEKGGIVRAPMFIEVLSLIAPDRIFDRCLEWCSGAGFIGFSLLGKGLCNQLDLADIWKPSLKAAQNVKVSCNINTWHIRRLADIQPPQQYDLIVGNPPWYPGNLLKNNRLTCDPGLSILKSFFTDVKNYLAPNGMIVLCEGQTYTGPKDILNALENTELEMTQVLKYDDRWHWFLVVEHKK